MIENNYDNKINFEGKQHYKHEGNVAYNKLLGYRETVKHSDMCNSKTRYAKELEYIEEAINEAQANNQDKLVKTLKKSKNRILKILKQFINDEDTKGTFFTIPYFVQKSKSERTLCLSDENKKIYDAFNEREIAMFNRLQNRYGLTDDNTVSYMLFDDKDFEKFKNAREKYKDLGMNYAVYITQFNDKQEKIFKHAMNDLGLEPKDAVDFVNMYEFDYSDIGTDENLSLPAHEELRKVVDEKTMENIAILSSYGVDIPNILDDSGKSSQFWRAGVGSLTKNVIEDIEKLTKAYRNLSYPPGIISTFCDNEAIQNEIQDKIKETFIPLVETQEDLDELKMGDVFRAFKNKGEEKLFIVKYINRNKRIPYELNMSPDAYLKLFPPVLRYSSVQGDDAEDCFLVTSLNILYDNKKLKSLVLDKFTEYPDGKIGIKLHDEIEYVCDPKNENLASKTLLRGAPGLQMLEIAYGANIILERIQDSIENSWQKSLEDYYIKIEKLENKMECTSDPKKVLKYEKQIKESKRKIEEIYNEALSITDDDLSKIYNSRKNSSQRNKGGNLKKACKNLDLYDYVHSIPCTDSIITHSRLEPGFKCYAGTTGNSDEDYLDEDLNIVENHAYMIMYEDGKFYAVNPWLSAQQVEIPQDKLDEYIDTIYYVG